VRRVAFTRVTKLYDGVELTVPVGLPNEGKVIADERG
jgi:hypothetical protein